MQIVYFPTTTEHPHGTVLIAHGYGEHHGRYRALIEALNGAGYDCATYDHPGHGTSDGPRARVDLGALINIHLKIRDDVLTQARTPELFLFGHSMGGLVTAASTILNPTRLRGTILTGPAMRPLPAVPAHVARRLLNVARTFPALPASTTHSAPAESVLARNPQVQRDFDADPLCHHGPVPLITGATMIVQGDEVLRRAAHLHTPTLIFHGSSDTLVSPAGSVHLIEAARAGGNMDAHLRMVDGARHEVLNEVEGPGIIRDIILWLDAH
ncbi:alpha/beta fold hydrolase [Schaalia suimastitidis]|uniref:alpha/beta fold hydrolase n=1 Tax=Schaalia suimastitidis TaxID=121163 RepID=UPI0004063589|nr:alpha/beta fold hydrolase [Schaalia suimastitidis]